MSPALALAAALAGGTPGAAVSPATWQLQVDNDVAFHTDRWFTSGLRLARVAPLEGGSPLASALRLSGTRSQHAEFGIVQEIYTGNPYAAPGDVDRPNAARLLFSAARHDLAGDDLVTLGVDAGVSGPAALGEQAQKAIHRIVPAPRTDWSSQPPDRADVQAVAAWSRFHAAGSLPGQVVSHAGAVAGNLAAFAHAGIEWRSAGTADVANPLLRFAATPPPAGQADGFGFFAGASVRAVARNRLLDRRGDDPRPAPAAESAIVRLAGGVAWRAPWGVAAFGLAQDSREFNGQTAPHRFGSLTVALRLD